MAAFKSSESHTNHKMLVVLDVATIVVFL